jgi:glycosyltransferase involved in cell wall biosynthesis
MKILHIVQALNEGGVPNVIINLIKEFHKMGIENVVTTPTKPSVEVLGTLRKTDSKLYITGLSVSPLNSYLYVILVLEKIREIALREKPDAIMIQPGWLSIFARALRIKLPIIIVIHGTYFNELKYMKYHPIFGLEKIRYMMGTHLSFDIEMFQLRAISTLRNAIIVAVSKNTRRELVRIGIPSYKVFSILNGVDKKLFKPMNEERARSEIERLFGIRLRDRVLLHVNPGPRKGTHILVKAVAILKRMYREDFTLLIAGRLGPKSYREYVYSMVKNPKLADNVRILGYVQQDKLPLLYNAADIAIVPSYSEGSPLVIPEALACGTPVIATNTGGNSEYLAMVGLKENITNISNYDFSCNLADTIERTLEGRFRVNVEAIPSWISIAKLYVETFKYLTEKSRKFSVVYNL